MNPIIEDIKKVMTSDINPTMTHHFSMASGIIVWAQHLFELGVKLKKSATEEQRKKYNDLVNAYVQIRLGSAQSIINETEVQYHEMNVKVYKNRIAELEKQVDSLQKQIEFLK